MLPAHAEQNGPDTYDFIIVGSGAGGGPLACNLARKRYRVLLIEAGGGHEPEESTIPAFHTQSTEEKTISWRYFVRHYGDKDRVQSRRDPKFRDEEDGVFYPRASGLGGCTVHNAMVTLSGPADDWDAIASLIDDRSWNSDRMRSYFERLENCHYIRPGYASRRVYSAVYDLLAKWRGNDGRHGFAGWLDTSFADPWLLVRKKDWSLIASVLAAVLVTWKEGMTSVRSLIWGAFTGTLAAQLDPNHWKRMRDRPERLGLVPMAVRDGQRRSVRDYILETKGAFPEHLTIWTDTLVTSVLFCEGTTEACGVSYLRGEALYQAHATPSLEEGEAGEVHAALEVILSAGAFNTPQLLMLSGIGPCEHLTELGIPVRLARPGVGTNLQDRYEVGVVWEMPDESTTLAPLTFKLDDPEVDVWRKTHEGPYAINGALISMMKKSRPDLLMPDLFIFALPGNFTGYFPGYSKPEIIGNPKCLTWIILKAHTKDRKGTVRLTCKDPRVRPIINFSYFHEGSDVEKDDLNALVEGVKFIRRMSRWRIGGVTERTPGARSTTDAELREFVTNEAWGHHASCSCPIGSDGDPMAVLDGSFRVRGTSRLRVVDASVFPQIPGVFIAANIYMLAERATDVLCDAYPR